MSWERVQYDPTPVPGMEWGYHGVAYGNGLFAAVGIEIATSADGRNWRHQERPCRTLLLNVAWGAGRFVAVGGGISLAATGEEPDPSAIVVSEDGLHWRTVLEEYLEEDEEAPSGARSFLLSDVVWTGTRFVAVGAGVGGMIMVSADGTAWERVQTTVQPNCESVAYGLGTYLISGPRLLSSTDSLRWTPVDLGHSGDFDFLGQVRYGDGWFVLTAAEPGRVLVSQDGSNWDLVWQADLGGWPYGIAFGRVTRVCVGINAGARPMVLTAGSDMRWSEQDISALIPDQSDPFAYLPLSGVAFGQGKFVAVGWSNLILLGAEVASGPPKLSELSIGAGGDVTFTVSASPNEVCRIEVSDDLQSWRFFGNVVTASDSVRVVDLTAGSFKARFYRAIIE